MLIWVTLAVGTATIVIGSLAMARIDERWRATHLQCCRCLRTWHGREKMCERCGGRGYPYDPRAGKYAGFPTHDWQGYLDTGPIPVVEVPAQRASAFAEVPSVPAQRVTYS